MLLLDLIKLIFKILKVLSSQTFPADRIKRYVGGICCQLLRFLLVEVVQVNVVFHVLGWILWHLVER